MNWNLVFTRTATILFWALFIGFNLSQLGFSTIYQLPPPHGPSSHFFGSLYAAILIIIVSFNLSIIWQEQHRWRGLQTLILILLCWLLGYPLSRLAVSLSFGAYTLASLIVLVPATVVAWVLVSPIGNAAGNWISRATAPNHMNLTGLQPKQVSELIGPPISILTLDSKVIYVYKRMKIVFADDKVIEIR